MAGQIEKKLGEMGLSLPAAPAPVANYVPVVRTGNLLFVSGQISRGPDGKDVVGKLGAGVSIEEGQQAARYCALNILAQVKAFTGDLDQIKQIVRLNGFVNSTAEFTDHPQVINGASNLMGELLGAAGKHSRCALGVSSLPFGTTVEIDAVIEVM